MDSLGMPDTFSRVPDTSSSVPRAQKGRRARVEEA